MGTAGWIGPRCELICACFKLTTRKLWMAWLNMSECKCRQCWDSDSTVSFREEAERCVKSELYLFLYAEQANPCARCFCGTLFSCNLPLTCPVSMKLRCNLSHPLGKIRGSLTERITPERNPIFKSHKGKCFGWLAPLPFPHTRCECARGTSCPSQPPLHSYISFVSSQQSSTLSLFVSDCLRTSAPSLHRHSFLRPTLLVPITVHFLLPPFLASSCAHNICVHNRP